MCGSPRLTTLQFGHGCRLPKILAAFSLMSASDCAPPVAAQKLGRAQITEGEEMPWQKRSIHSAQQNPSEIRPDLPGLLLSPWRLKCLAVFQKSLVPLVKQIPLKTPFTPSRRFRRHSVQTFPELCQKSLDLLMEQTLLKTPSPFIRKFPEHSLPTYLEVSQKSLVHLTERIPLKRPSDSSHMIPSRSV
eukprot:RCo034248